ncbi:MAG: hypothetical protein JW993_20935 [Sedimentisphaerales bacterium]|nr:hypothetical protein [Sedimentisphaerales bacterium]
MKSTRRGMTVVVLAMLLLAGASAPAVQATRKPVVTAPPESFFKMIEQRISGPRRGFRGRRDGQEGQAQQGPTAEQIAAEMAIYRNFYKKYVDVKGLPVASHGDVADQALLRTYEIVTHMLAGRPDILQAMVDNNTYLIIIGKEQVYTDMPEYRNSRNPDFQNERVRGTGGNPTSFGEENLLSLPIDRYDDESIGVHEFCHTIDSTLRSIDPTWRERKDAVYRNAVEKGLFRNTYAGSNSAEYWCETAQAYFDNNRVNNWNHGPIGRREQLKQYDPMGYELVRTTFNLSPEQDWRYRWLQELPCVTVPPAKFNIDPYYTKFTWAREFTVIGRQASNEALLKANDTIRKMFAYRHDVLKALITDGVKVVVLGPNEHIYDLPECKKLSDPKSIDALARYLTYTPELRLLVVGEENVMADPSQPYVGDNQVIRVFADAIYRVTGTRPVDPEFENRSRGVWQQYELGLTRLDERFDARLKEIYENAMGEKKWIGSAAVNDRVAYWTMGVLAYFDAVGHDDAPADAAHGIRTREALAEYDPGLFELVKETMAYENQVDWRYQPYH